MVELKNLFKKINGKIIYKDINLSINKGETVVILGQSGEGKTTLLKSIIGLDKPTAGKIFVLGEEITRMPEEKLNQIRKRMGMVFQNAALFDSLTVRENVAFPLREHTRFDEEKIRKIVKEKLEIMGMENTENLLPAQLSGGMQRRVGIARALALSPEIVLYDEPTTGLDPVMTEIISDLILELKNRLKVTSVVVTHDMNTAFKIGDRLGMLHQGSLVAIGDKETIFKSNIPIVQQFVKEIKRNI